MRSRPGERVSGLCAQGHGEGRRVGDRAPHAAPAHHQPLLPRGAQVPVAQEPVEGRVEVGRGEEPDKARAQDHAVDRRGVEQNLREGVHLELTDDGGQLLADQDEEQRLQDEDHHAPERERWMRVEASGKSLGAFHPW
jgi:hypothetical protein